MVLAESCCSDTGHRYDRVVSMIRAHTVCATSSVAEHAQLVVARVVRATSRAQGRNGTSRGGEFGWALAGWSFAHKHVTSRA